MNDTNKTVIHLDDIHKHYDMGDTQVAALKGINLNIQAGEFTALKGPSGSGKSTLLNICGLLDKSNQGRLEFLGNNINGASSKQLTELRRENIGFIFQSYNLLPVLSASENVEYPLLLSTGSKQQRQSRVDEVIEQVGLEKFASHRPDHLSGGQRQRVAIARALVNKPAIVIADEPTANLDTETASQMIELMHELGKSQGTTFLIATHDDRMAEHCDRILSMVDGLITDGSGQGVSQ